MSVRDLRELVNRYLLGAVDYAAFRNGFLRFIAVEHQDQSLNKLAEAIEGLCSDYAMGFLQEPGLRESLASLLPTASASSEAITYVVLGSVEYFGGSVVLEKSSYANDNPSSGQFVVSSGTESALALPA